MTLPEFVAKWKASTLSERAAYQQHFLDLCALLGQQGPAEADPKGESYAFEKNVTKTTGTKGYADVWRRKYFAFEYKGKGKNLADAYQQLLRYREDLENPRILVVTDLERFEVHTNFTDTVKQVYAFNLTDLEAGAPTPTCARVPLEVLRAVFTNPESLRPTLTTAGVTDMAARAFSQLAVQLSRPERGNEPHAVAQFLIRLLFCLFAEDVSLLPSGLFSEVLNVPPAEVTQEISNLFAAMEKGGRFALKPIKHFNGGLFTDGEVLALEPSEIAILREVAKLDWSAIEPSIFGTLFERSLDPSKRSQLGAHYTSRADIELIVEPVVMKPLRRRWAEVRAKTDPIVQRRSEIQNKGAVLTPSERSTLTRTEGELKELLTSFSEELSAVRVLDPACGSGNFLYVALRALLDLEKQAISYALGTCGLTGFFPKVGPEHMFGLELNEYAAELAPVTVWIGYIQWLRDNGFGEPAPPILRSMDQIREGDAVLSDDGTEPAWPDADFIIGNPPFLGDKMMRGELGNEYTARLRALYSGRVDGGADLVTYWFERARALIEAGKVKRAGLISTNSIRNGANRKVLDKIATGGGIFAAWADHEWTLDGAAVNVSLVCFDGGGESERTLDGKPVQRINPDLTATVADLTTARPLVENAGLVFLGMMKGGPFDIDEAKAQTLLSKGANPNGRPNSDVIRRRLGAQNITNHSDGGWIIDFAELSEEDAELYEAPFEYVRQHVKPLRDANRDARMNRFWWLHGRSRPALRSALTGLDRSIVTPEVAKHRLFAWMPTTTVPDHSCHVFARADDYFFGVLHSHVHEVWSLAIGNTLEDRPRYNSASTFGTFPMPWAPGTEPSEADSPLVAEIARAARLLVERRNNVLNDPDSKQTLTGLYNLRPAWLGTLHTALDRAVLAAYAHVTDEEWPESLTDDELLVKLLALNHQRAGQ